MTAASRRTIRRTAKLLVFALAGLGALPSYSEESTQTVRLKYRDDGFEVGLGQPFSWLGDLRFKKEPPFDGHQVYRFPIVHTFVSGRYFGAAWDETTGKLYVDANRNLDLTDDEVITPTRVPPRQSFQILQNVTVRVERPVRRTYRMDLVLLPRSGSYACSVTMRSGWEGEMQISGEPWTIAVIDNMDGRIDHEDRLLIFRKRDYAVDHATANALFGLPVTSVICVGDTRLQLSYTLEPAGDEPDLAVTETERRLPSGELEITGANLERVVLDGTNDVILDAPHGVVKVPEGGYTLESARVYDPVANLAFTVPAPLGASRSTEPSQNLPTAVSVQRDRRTPFRVGAPLENRVSAERRGSQVSCSYQLVGLGGETYQEIERAAPADGNPDKAALLVQAGGRRQAVGSFEYG